MKNIHLRIHGNNYISTYKWVFVRKSQYFLSMNSSPQVDLEIPTSRSTQNALSFELLRQMIPFFTFFLFTSSADMDISVRKFKIWKYVPVHKQMVPLSRQTRR